MDLTVTKLTPQFYILFMEILKILFIGGFTVKLQILIQFIVSLLIQLIMNYYTKF